MQRLRILREYFQGITKRILDVRWSMDDRVRECSPIQWYSSQQSHSKREAMRKQPKRSSNERNPFPVSSLINLFDIFTEFIINSKKLIIYNSSVCLVIVKVTKLFPQLPKKEK